MSVECEALLEPTQQMTEMLRACAHDNDVIRTRAIDDLAKAFNTKATNTPIRQGVFDGNVLGSIFDENPFLPGQPTEYPIDMVPQGREKDFIAYTIPNTGAMAVPKFEGNRITVDCYRVGAGAALDLRWIRDARWDVVARVMQIIEAQFVRKNNLDGFVLLLTAAYGRGLMIADSTATSGLFSKRLQSLMNTAMARYSGGNSMSVTHGKMSHLFMSLEGVEDIRSWDLTQIDDFTRREIYVASQDDGMPLTKIGPSIIVPMYEFGVGQEYQNYWSNTLSGSLGSGKLELVLGIDKRPETNDSFVHPIREEWRVFLDPTAHKRSEMEWYARGEWGWACLNSTRVIGGSF